MSKDPVWVLLAEFPLSDFLPDQNRKEEPTAGVLLQSLRELGMSSECMEHIARTLAGFARETSLRATHGRLEIPRRVGIFCQKKVIGEADSANPSKASNAELGKEQKQIIPGSRAKAISGWGYFTIERGEDLPPDSPAVSQSYIDLYLYKEGE